MKKPVAVLAAFCLGFGIQQVLAADLPNKGARACFDGGNELGRLVHRNQGGGDWGHFTQTNTITNVSLGSFSQKGGLVGGTLGYNWQSGIWVYGLETDLSWTNSAAHKLAARPARISALRICAQSAQRVHVWASPCCRPCSLT